jgi:predicted metal-binding protein
MSGGRPRAPCEKCGKPRDEATDVWHAGKYLLVCRPCKDALRALRGAKKPTFRLPCVRCDGDRSSDPENITWHSMRVCRTCRDVLEALEQKPTTPASRLLLPHDLRPAARPERSEAPE